MTRMFTLKNPVHERPLSEWKSIAVELLGTQSRIVQGKRFHHHIIEAGDGPPLFLYHGIGGHVETYARTLPQLAKHFHVVAAEAIYHGYSSRPPFDPDNWVDVMVDGVVDLADAMGFDTFSYEGESMGGFMGVNLGFRYPERVDKLILNGFTRVNSPIVEGFKPNPARGDLWTLSQAAVSDPSYANIRARLEWLVAVPERITDEMVDIRQRLYSDPGVNESMRGVFGMNGGPGRVFRSAEVADFEKFSVGERTLLLWGEWNPHDGYEHAKFYADLVGGQFYGVDDSGHWPQWEHPDEYVQVITEFLQS